MPQLGRRLRSLRFTFGLAPTGFTACRETGDPVLEHALADRATLCGIPQRQVTAYRHLFVAKRSGRCSACRVKATDATSMP
jgi:ferredoxin